MTDNTQKETTETITDYNNDRIKKLTDRLNDEVKQFFNLSKLINDSEKKIEVVENNINQLNIAISELTESSKRVVPDTLNVHLNDTSSQE